MGSRTAAQTARRRSFIGTGHPEMNGEWIAGLVLGPLAGRAYLGKGGLPRAGGTTEAVNCKLTVR